MNKTTIAFLFGILLALIAGRLYVVSTSQIASHPIGYADSDDEVHVHSDFIVYLDGEAIDLSADKYQTTAMQTVHAHIHLHDNNDEVIHRHDPGVTLGDFFGSLGFTLTDECITTDTEDAFCSTDDEQLLFFVNGKPLENPASYVNKEEDRILVYFGEPDNELIPFLLDEVTNKSCIYSGTCPERGTAPPESCGLTCEL